tara:strand:+ start:353 stop:574 length:222 start_codon:yes stop_codon:yes gene_type:complete
LKLPTNIKIPAFTVNQQQFLGWKKFFKLDWLLHKSSELTAESDDCAICTAILIASIIELGFASIRGANSKAVP